MSDDLGLEGLLADAMSASDEAFSSEEEGMDPAMLAMLGGSEPEAAPQPQPQPQPQAQPQAQAQNHTQTLGLS